MRTVSKDIMMICKGWYTNREEISKRQYEAIQEYVSNEFTTVCLLGECKPWWIRFKNDEVEDDL